MKILLDIDGVLNTGFLLEKETQIIDFDWGKWRVPTDLLDMLKNEQENLDFIWCSTWLDMSNAINKYLGIETFEYIDVISFSSDFTWQKSKAIAEYCYAHSDEQILLIDDDAHLGLLELSKIQNLSIIIPDKLGSGLDLNEFYKEAERLKTYEC